MKAELIDSMGTDLTVVNAARVSFDKESYWATNWGGDVDGLLDRDEKLIKYLAKHGHWTPFAHPHIMMRETVPIFVARQRFKHMVGFTYNEISRRYVDDDPEFFYPEEWRSRPEGSVKQGSGEEFVSTIRIKNHAEGYDSEPGFTYSAFLEGVRLLYESMIEGGIAPEQARMVLPQSMYTSYYVTGSLAAWARAYKQRIDDHAQKEIQDLAKQWGEIIKPLFPVSWNELTK